MGQTSTGLPRLRGSHTGENIATSLAAVIQKYQFEHRLGCFMMDNASNNNGLYTQLSRSFPMGQNGRLRCVGHMINLIVKALIYGKGVGKLEKDLIGASDQGKFDLMRKKGFVGKIHNITKYIMRSTAVIFLDWSGVDLSSNPLHPASKLFDSRSCMELQCIYILNIERLGVSVVL